MARIPSGVLTQMSRRNRGSLFGSFVLGLAAVASLSLLSGWLPCFTGLGAAAPGRQVGPSRRYAAAEDGGSTDEASALALDDLSKVTKKSKKVDSEKFDAIIKAASAFTTKAERAKRRQAKMEALATITLEDNLRGMSLENAVDDSEAMIASARRKPKLDTNFEGRFKAWRIEMWNLIQNPSDMQRNYLIFFTGTVLATFSASLIFISLGGVRLLGEEEEDIVRNYYESDLFKEQMAYKMTLRKFRSMDAIRPDSSLGELPEESEDMYDVGPQRRKQYKPPGDYAY